MADEFDIRLIAEKYFARIHRAALMLSGNPWEADDLAQETFLVLSRSPEQFRGHSSVYTWLYGILLNLERSQRRRLNWRTAKLHWLWSSEQSSSKSSDEQSHAESAEWKRSLWSRVAQLPDGQRHVLMLRFSEQLPYEEIAEILGCPLGTVKSRMFHGLAALREKMRTEFNDELAPTTLPLPKRSSHAV